MSVCRTILKIALVTGVVCSTTLTGLACGFNWMPYGGYFECCDNQGYVLLTEKLADLTIPGESESVPIWMFFTSENSIPSPYAGMWRIGILDISLVQVNEKQFRMQDPAGNEILLSWDKKKNLLEGSGWKGSFTRDRAKLWASCGWSVEFNCGKIARMTTPHNKSLVFNYADGLVSSITCDRKALIAIGSVKGDTLDITINGKKLGIVKTDQPYVQWVKNAAVNKGTIKSLHEISGRGDGTGRSYTYSVDEKMQPVINATGKNERDIFTLAWDPKTRKIVHYKDWEYTKIRDRKNKWDTIELSRKNSKGEVESVYRDSEAGIDITQRGNVKRSEYRFTSGPAAGKMRRIEDMEGGKITHFQKYAYDEKGRPIRGEENADKLRFEYNDKNRTAAAWRNDKMLWRKFMDAQGRIVKVEYPDDKELRLAYPEKHPATAELVCKNASIAVQLTSEGLVKERTKIIRWSLK